jgi:hypothetical protein
MNKKYPKNIVLLLWIMSKDKQKEKESALNILDVQVRRDEQNRRISLVRKY